jgi:hypothetical protein
MLNWSNLNVTVTTRVSPGFAAIPAFCEGTTAPVLATTSPNGISGTWNPAQIDNKTSGSYVLHRMLMNAQHLKLNNYC